MNLNKLRDKAYQCAVGHRWHEENLSDEHFLCLVISELMEAVEADRKGSHADTEAFNKYYDCVDFKENFERQIKGTVEEELADSCIRLLDLAGLRSVDLGEILVFCVQKDIDILWHIERKMKYNELRSYKHGGKVY